METYGQLHPWQAYTLSKYTHPKWKLYSGIMGFTIHEKKPPVSHNAGNEIQSCVGMLNVNSWGVSL